MVSRARQAEGRRRDHPPRRRSRSSRATRCAATRATCRSPRTPARGAAAAGGGGAAPRRPRGGRPRGARASTASTGSGSPPGTRRRRSRREGRDRASRGSRGVSARSLDDDTVVVNEYPLDRRYLAFDRPRQLLRARRTRAGSASGLRRRARRQARRAGDDGHRRARRRRVLLQRADGLPHVPRAARAARAHRDLQQPAVGGGEAERARRAPDGWAKSTGRFPLSELTPSPRFEEIVRAFDGHGERVETPSRGRARASARPRRRARGPPGGGQRGLRTRAGVTAVRSQRGLAWWSTIAR